MLLYDKSKRSAKKVERVETGNLKFPDPKSNYLFFEPDKVPAVLRHSKGLVQKFRFPFSLFVGNRTVYREPEISRKHDEKRAICGFPFPFPCRGKWVPQCGRIYEQAGKRSGLWQCSK